MRFLDAASCELGELPSFLCGEQPLGQGTSAETGGSPNSKHLVPLYHVPPPFLRNSIEYDLTVEAIISNSQGLEEIYVRGGACIVRRANHAPPVRERPAFIQRRASRYSARVQRFGSSSTSNLYTFRLPPRDATFQFYPQDRLKPPPHLHVA